MKSPSQLNVSASFHRTLLLAVAILFAVIFGTALFSTNFLPFGFDNNETFSSIVHARNMHEYGIASTAGLTDESYGRTPESHPYVYTHQGNFPRLYAYLMYALGIDTPEAQIAVSTFTIGLGAILLCFRFFSQMCNPMIAFVVCLLLMTDYVMSAQWLVNTWRVWQAFLFFLFSCLLLRASRASLSISCALAIVATSGVLFYTEIVFAAFVATFGCIFFAWQNRPFDARRTLIVTFLTGIGAALSLGILFGQSVIHLGWDVFWQDFQFTFIARNMAPSGTAEQDQFSASVLDFMTRHRIVYWDNQMSRDSGLGHPVTMLRVLFRYNLFPYTPLLYFTALIGLGGVLFGAVGDKLASAKLASLAPMQRWLSVLITPTEALFYVYSSSLLFSSILFFSGYIVGVSATTASLFYPHYLKIFVILVGLATFIFSAFSMRNSHAFRLFVLQIRTNAATRIGLVGLAVFLTATIGYLNLEDLRSNLSAGKRLYLLVTFAVPPMCAALAALLLLIPARADRHRASSGYTIAQITSGCAFSVACSALLLLGPFLSRPAVSPIGASMFVEHWADLLRNHGGFFLGRFVVFCVYLLALKRILGSGRPAKEVTTPSQLQPLAGYLICGMAAFLVVWILFPGYIFTAYFARYCPYLIFVIVVLFVFSLPVSFHWPSVEGFDAQRVIDRLRRKYLHLRARCSPVRIGLIGGKYFAAPMISLICCGYLLSYWINVQAAHLTLIPLDRYGGLFAALREIKGRTTVVSTYAAPVATLTDAWSYFDPVFFAQASDIATPVNPESFKRDYRYLWLADRVHNAAYTKPEYFVCWTHENLHDLFYSFHVDMVRPSCSNLAGITAIREGNQSKMYGIEVARDPNQWRDLWSVIKLSTHDAR